MFVCVLLIVVWVGYFVYVGIVVTFNVCYFVRLFIIVVGFVVFYDCLVWCLFWIACRIVLTGWVMVVMIVCGVLSDFGLCWFECCW